MRSLHFLFALMLACCLPLATAQELVAVPGLTGHVVDKAGMLAAPERAALDDMLSQYEARTGSQIAVLLIPSTAPEAIEQYSIRVADAWKLGRKNVDDGVILLVAKDNPKALRRLRIEAGRGVQGSLTDLQSKRILQDVMAPFFQRNDFNGGLAAGVTAIMALLDKEQFPAPPAGAEPATVQNETPASWLPFLLLGAFLLLGMFRRSKRGRGGSNLGNNSWGNTAGVILGSLIASGGSRGSGGGSGGGFSGGGGGFDGGGASGDW
ncbi:TPM domain-containing protein [Actimicrobium antarcticum]|uniref:TPM domain-containing protein n=1 Tax=Actimicrobium antarcticum TaxID=1051899 RepID=A0ABP7TW13_9BURK